MYNKIFTKILDSSIWLEPNSTRIVWFTFLASMDEDGFAQFASVKNLAHRAIVSIEEAEEAVKCLESPDPDSSDPESDGRRIERIPGGWMVLNAVKYRDIVTRAVSQEMNRKRVAKHREKRKCNGDVTVANVLVMESEAETETEAVSEAEAKKKERGVASLPLSMAEGVQNAEGVNPTPKQSKPSPSVFQKPFIDEMQVHAASLGMPPAEGQKAWHFYESKGWRVGNQPMKSWKSCLVTWHSRWKERQPQTGGPVGGKF